MIIDSHAHYCHKLYEGEFTYLDRTEAGFCLARGDRRTMLEAMRRRGIGLCIEPATGLDRLEGQLALAQEYGPYVRLALGLHPKQCILTPWEDRERLREAVQAHRAVAIGETGLDYSIKNMDPNVPYQKIWFTWQIRLAHEMELPLILHVRDAEQDALAILEAHRQLLHGGVAHCFHGDYGTAMAYAELGFALGIGGKLLEEGSEGEALRDAVRRVPLSAILVETDAPYIRPDIAELVPGRKQRNKVRNSSLILPLVIETIAQLREEAAEAVEEAVYQNTVRVFRLEDKEESR